MTYFSKTIILHQIENGFSMYNKAISGICRFEREDGIFNCYLTFMNIEKQQDGAFYFCLVDEDKRLFTVELKDNVKPLNHIFEQIPKVENRFSVGLYYVKDNIPLLIAYSTFNNGESILSMKKALYEKHIKNPIKPASVDVKPVITASDIEEISQATTPKESAENIMKEIQSLYDDEAVATENYYDKDDEIKEKLDFIAKFENENFESEKATTKDKDNDLESQVEGAINDIQMEEVAFTSEKKKVDTLDDFLDNSQEIFKDINLDDIGDNTEKEKIDYSQENPYYEHIRNDIQDILAKFPEDKSLQNIIPNSKFVRINYAENKFYIVGVVFERKKEKYICYGIPDKYSKTPPKELKGYCQFIPLSMFNLSGDGYWMMFQDAVNGACVKLK